MPAIELIGINCKRDFLACIQAFFALYPSLSKALRRCSPRFEFVFEVSMFGCPKNKRAPRFQQIASSCRQAVQRRPAMFKSRRPP